MKQTPGVKICDVYAVEQEEYLIRAIEEIGMIEFLPITTNVLQIFDRKLSATIFSRSLKHVIRIGWSDTKEEMTPEISNYFDLKEELTLQNGILF